MKQLSRREFLKQAALASAVVTLAGHEAQGAPADAPAPERVSGGPQRLRWLEGTPPLHAGVAWGAAWPPGLHVRGTRFALSTGGGRALPIQSWPTAYWPDGSLKWTGHALAPGTAIADSYLLDAGETAQPERALRVASDEAAVRVFTGIIECRIPRGGAHFIDWIRRDGEPVMEHGRLVGQLQGGPGPGAAVEPFEGVGEELSVEQEGPLRAVVKISGRHRTQGGRLWLPYTLRLYFHAGAEALRVVHSFVFDGDSEKDFLRSLGLRFDVPLRDEAYNRHVRFVGEGNGLWAEAVQGLTGLRRDPGEAVRMAQVAGRAVPGPEQWDESVSSRRQWIPRWGDFTLSQLSANGFNIKKRTDERHGWVAVDQGRRAAGVGYVGGVSGGVVFGMRDFWQLHPTQLDIRNANTDKASVTLWMFSPEAPPMDLRFYHGGMGLDSYPEQLEAMNITYEDYEAGFGTPHGVARSSDFTLWALGSTPPRERLVEMADAVRRPPQLVARPGDYHHAGVFGGLWDLPDRSSPARRAIEDRLDWQLRYYTAQVEQRHWYGFWDYGDIMHTYDSDRHVWRYDVGGYAWDNSELSPDLWLWLSFLRSGGAANFRLAEAMTRHNRDVDIYHLGRFAGLGSRHNVMHWGDSAKQLRISTAAYRRFHYYLTTDERTGDVLAEVADADRQLGNINPVRKLPGQPFRVEQARIGIGTDWGSAAANWLAAWERTGDARYRDWLLKCMRAIGNAELGFFTGTFAYDVDSKQMTPPADALPNVSHLSAVFGLVEVCAELVQLLDVPEFKAAWLRYCRLYNAPDDVQRAELGTVLQGTNLKLAHSRLTAWAAASSGDPALAERAWTEFRVREWGPEPSLKTERVEGPRVLNPVDEAAWLSTNDAAQWGLAAIQNLALVPEALS